MGEHRPADINAIIEESLNLAYHGPRAKNPASTITLKREFDPAAGMVDSIRRNHAGFLNLISNGFYAATSARRQAGKFEPD